jgi:tryptophan 2,3-dioxygenase
LQTEILHTLQQTVSDHPGEYAFLINVQVQELYWALIVKEMQAAQACLREDNLAEAHEACSEWWMCWHWAFIRAKGDEP